LENKPVSNGMAFIPRSSNQFHCYRFGPRFVKRKQEADPPNTSGQQQNITENLFPALRRHREPLTLTIWKPFDISSFPQAKGRQNWPALRGYGPSFDTFLTVLRKPAEREEMAAGELHIELPGS